MNYIAMPGFKFRPEVRTKIDRFQSVVNAVCHYYGITEKQIKARTRKSEIVEARFVTYYILHNIFGITKVEIGRRYRLNHATIINGINRCTDLIMTEPEVGRNVNLIQQLLTT